MYFVISNIPRNILSEADVINKHGYQNNLDVLHNYRGDKQV